MEKVKNFKPRERGTTGVGDYWWPVVAAVDGGG